jgi:hypothetical protein
MKLRLRWHRLCHAIGWRLSRRSPHCLRERICDWGFEHGERARELER